jgi:hypothetical protein
MSSASNSARRAPISPSLVAALPAYCRDAKIAPTGSVFATSYRGALRPLSRQMAWELVTGLAAREDAGSETAQAAEAEVS